MPLAVLLVVFIVVPLLELYVILQVGDAIGVLPTLALLVADSLLGSYLLKSQGRQVWRRFNEATAAGRIPHSEIIDGVLIIFGGAFLITPGFLTDIVGLLFLLPPTRAAFRRTVRRGIERGTVWGRVGGAAVRAGQARRETRTQNGVPGDYVEGTAHEVDTETRRLEP
ncbi:MAG TPA: FxsA family protein [Thermoleophilaceae bacterium]|nr:FxsA family protein [Thermoleophilaceae bacterium]